MCLICWHADNFDTNSALFPVLVDRFLYFMIIHYSSLGSMITICIRAPQRGNEMSAQGFRPPRNGGNEGGVKTIEHPGYPDNRIFRPERAAICQPRAAPWVRGQSYISPWKGKRMIFCFNSFALSGRRMDVHHIPRALPWADILLPLWGAWAPTERKNFR